MLESTTVTNHCLRDTSEWLDSRCDVLGPLD